MSVIKDVKVVITNDNQSCMGVVKTGVDQPGTKNCLVTWMLIPARIPHGKLMHSLHVFKCWDFCACSFCLPPAPPVCLSVLLRHKQIFQGTALKYLLRL